jgi:general secretion pathway protein G
MMVDRRCSGSAVEPACLDSRGAPRGGFAQAQRAFTLFELMLVLAILGVIIAIAVPSYQQYQDRLRITQAKVDIRNIEGAIMRFYANNNQFPDTLAQVGMDSLRDPWGNPYQYLNITTAKGHGKVRKDHKLVPINSDFDLYSMGKDGDSKSPLTAKASRDDIIRANNGSFVGPAADY